MTSRQSSTTQTWAGTATFLGLTGLPGLAAAQQAVITYNNGVAGAQAIPAAGPLALMAGGAALAVLGGAAIRRGNNRSLRSIAALTAASGLGLAAWGGGVQTQQVWAQTAYVEWFLSDHPSPVTVDQFPAQITNDRPEPALIQSIQIDNCPTGASPSITGTCQVGDTLAPAGGQCSLDSVCATTGPVGSVAGIEPLNDTGLTWGGDYPSGNNTDCSGETVSAQDCSYGRDADPATNDDTDGHAGFSFTKLDAAGNPLDASATDWSCVQDNVTGLVWEIKTDDGGLRDRDWTYTSYDSRYADTNDNFSDGGDDGVYAGPVDTGSGSESDNCGNTNDICTTEQFVVDVNAQGLCGHRDWRMPDLEELRSVVHYDRFNPAIDTHWFPHATSSVVLSASAAADYEGFVLAVSFGSGGVSNPFRNDARRVRLVRGGQ